MNKILDYIGKILIAATLLLICILLLGLILLVISGIIVNMKTILYWY